MRKLLLILLLGTAGLSVFAQKKPLDHSVYDEWQNVNEHYISNDGRWVAYTITPQQGDGLLVIQASDSSWKKEIPRGYAATITEDNRFVICKVRPFFKDTREARIKKKKPDDMPKDSLVIVETGKDIVLTIPRIQSYKTPENGDGQWMAYLKEKPIPAPPALPDSATQLNNLLRMADSLRALADEAKTKGLTILKPKKTTETVNEGSVLVLRNLATGEEKQFNLVKDYLFNTKGTVLVFETTRSNTDTLVQPAVNWYDVKGNLSTVMRRFNDAKNYSLDEDGNQLAFIAERDSAAKSLAKFYKLWYYRPGMDSAQWRAGNLPKGLTISDHASIQFSKNGQRLFFGLMPIRKQKDTSLPDFETARLDIWHYNDDYLQPQQLVQLPKLLQRSYLAVLNGDDTNMVQLTDGDIDSVVLADEGNQPYILATSTKGARMQMQWSGYYANTAWIVSTLDGSRKLVKEKLRADFSISPKGRYVAWYDVKARHYFTWSVATGAVTNITKSIKVPLYDEDDDHPDDPPPHGKVQWDENDRYVYVYDKYDIWRCDPQGKQAPRCMTNGYGRTNKFIYRHMPVRRDEKFIPANDKLVLRRLEEKTKKGGFDFWSEGDAFPYSGITGAFTVGPRIVKAKNAGTYLFTLESYKMPPVVMTAVLKDSLVLHDLYQTNPQQKNYNWLTAELVRWKMFDGKPCEGMLFKPENFDTQKKYPVLFYFYERSANGLYNYRPPAPSASTINIPYFVSNGYLVFVPDIYYKNGQPGESAYNSVVSAARHLSKMPYVDSTKMGIQGQSWGGYQVAYLVTRTNLFAAAGAGAPVSNMTSAYGGIRWQSGLSRQFQYERTQSRIGYTLWERPDLYIKNSPLFKADKINTPLLIMHNDADGAVPWYQGIELFTALRRLDKKVWMLQYNGEGHNLMERRNRKDLSIRLAQFFDHYLKGAPAARWITEGLPAAQKGIEWGIETEEKKSF